VNHPGSSGAGQDFKELFEKSLRQTGLSPRALHLELRRQRAAELHLPETTIDSWLRPHSTTGRPSLPRAERVVSLVAQWLCAREGVSATAEELIAAWRADTSYRARRRGGPAPATAVGPLATSPAPMPEIHPSAGVVTFLSARRLGPLDLRSAGQPFLLRGPHPARVPVRRAAPEGRPENTSKPRTHRFWSRYSRTTRSPSKPRMPPRNFRRTVKPMSHRTSSRSASEYSWT
jgi:hypothetical protein